MSSQPVDFGQLRSWMNQPKLNDAQRDALWEAVLLCAHESPRIYESRWQPYLSGFTHHFQGPFATLRSLKDLEHATRLMPWSQFCLDVSYSWLGDVGVKAVAESPSAASLSSLVLRFDKVEAKGVEALASSPHLSQLTLLDLRRNEIEAAGAEALAASAVLSNLHSLNLGHGKIGDKGIHALAQSTNLLSVRHLDLRFNEIEGGLAALTKSSYVSNLHSLDVSGNELGDAGAHMLAKSSHLSGLTSLNISATKVGPRGRKALARSPFLCPAIRELFT